ncbi:MAG: 50S ribosomal protein L4 [Puniceicoccales bacterium]|jgi:large subunit ribosomal protein L4|nr:50S ribosomal protein L4 [Puniceicoccales bacterium]
MKLKVYTADGAASAEKDFAIPAFEGDKGVALLKQTVIAYQANQRQGTSKTKDYGEVAGSGKKILRQKGSGGSRHGDKRAPQLYKGGVVFGPRPRDWSKTITARAKKLALARALFELAGDGGLNVIERFEVEKPKTKLLNAVIEKINPLGKVLIVDIAWTDNTALAVGNIERVFVTDATSLNALDLVRFHQVIISEQGLAKVLERTTTATATATA